MAKVDRVKDMEKVAGEMAAVWDTQEMLAFTMGKPLMESNFYLHSN